MKERLILERILNKRKSGESNINESVDQSAETEVENPEVTTQEPDELTVVESATCEELVGTYYELEGNVSDESGESLEAGSLLYFKSINSEDGSLEFEVLDAEDEDVAGVLTMTPEEFQALCDEDLISQLDDSEDDEDSEEDDEKMAENLNVNTNEENLDEATKKVVRGGKVMTIQVKKKKKKRLSPAQKQALAKARKKANTGAAKKARAKSMKVRRNRLGESTQLAILEDIAESYGLSIIASDYETIEEGINFELVINDELDENVIVDMEEFSADLMEHLGTEEIQIPEVGEAKYNGVQAKVMNFIIAD
ncbi:hypothetical protein HSE3_gp066 [Bacillus phage vB_BceM-HSE3]|nr:hypothetical protein HSE3_gp066 [Bacillus phage vB_BceM-HSE3]